VGTLRIRHALKFVHDGFYQLEVTIRTIAVGVKRPERKTRNNGYAKGGVSYDRDGMLSRKTLLHHNIEKERNHFCGEGPDRSVGMKTGFGDPTWRDSTRKFAG